MARQSTFEARCHVMTSDSDEHRALVQRLGDDALGNLLRSLVDQDVNLGHTVHCHVVGERGRAPRGGQIRPDMIALFTAAKIEYEGRTRAPVFDADERITGAAILELQGSTPEGREEVHREAHKPRYETVADTACYLADEVAVNALVSDVRRTAAHDAMREAKRVHVHDIQPQDYELEAKHPAIEIAMEVADALAGYHRLGANPDYLNSRK